MAKEEGIKSVVVGHARYLPCMVEEHLSEATSHVSLENHARLLLVNICSIYRRKHVH
jgi:hypothetical protein